MKTTTNRTRSAIFTATACTAMILGSIAFAQQNDEPSNKSLVFAFNDIKKASDTLEKFLRFEAPLFSEKSEYAFYKVRLDENAAQSEKMLKYKAPSLGAVEAFEAKRELKTWADNMGNSLRYVAPSVEMIEFAEVKAELQRSAGEFADAARYEAPSIEAVEVKEARADLSAWAEMTRRSLIYEAPSIQSVEAEEAFEKLEISAKNAEKEIRYIAPALETIEAE